MRLRMDTAKYPAEYGQLCLLLVLAYVTVELEVTKMAENVGSKVSFFLVGLGIGALVGILFAPKSREYAQKKARELRERAEDLIERSKEIMNREKGSITAAVEAGKETYQREKTKAQAQ